jgi:hypothetical protein
MKRILGLILAVAVAGVLAAASQAGNRSQEPSPRYGALHVTKECSAYSGLAGQFCTITSSNLKAIKVGSRVVYASAAGGTSLDSDLILYSGHDRAFGHVVLDFVAKTGAVTFSGGTGQLSGFNASVAVSLDPATGLWHWDGRFWFRPRGEDQDGYQ